MPLGLVREYGKSTKKLAHARVCRLKQGSNQRSKGKEQLKYMCVHTKKLTSR